MRNLLIVWLALMSPHAWGVDCSPANITLTTQAEVDGFQSIHGPCDQVVGSLQISGNDISDVDGLTGIVDVGDLLDVGNNPLLSSLDGFSNVTSVHYLHIHGNTALTNIDALSSLTNVEILHISENPLLTDLDSLSSITTVYLLFIEDQPLLTDIDGLAGLTNIDTDLIIANTGLTNVDGLSGVTNMGGIGLSGNTALNDLSGLSNITSLENSLFLGQNNALESLIGFSNLTSIGGVLGIAQNASLANLDGLAGLLTIGSSVYIEGNPLLSNLNGLGGILEIPGDLDLSGNFALTDIDGLSGLKSIQGNLIITYSQLENIDALIDITTIPGSLELRSNQFLSDCSALVRLLGWPSGPPDDYIGDNISVSENALGCNSVAQMLASVSGPTAPVITSTVTNHEQITLYFDESTTTDRLYPIEGYLAVCVGDSVETLFEPDVGVPIPDEGGISNQLITQNFGPIPVLPEIEVDIDITHPRTRHLVITLTSPEGTVLTLWDEGVGTGTDLIGTFPTTLTPVDDLSQIADEDLNGAWTLQVNDVVAGFVGSLNSWGVRIRERVTESGAHAHPAIVINALTNEQEYTCTVSPVTLLGVFPASSEAAATPMVPEVVFQNGFE